MLYVIIVIYALKEYEFVFSLQTLINTMFPMVLQTYKTFGGTFTHHAFLYCTSLPNQLPRETHTIGVGATSGLRLS